MIHWKVLVMIGRNDHSAPLVYAVEFDTEGAADQAAAWYHDGGFVTTVIKDDEADQPATAPAETPALEPVAA
jgi:hypothetical protein